MQFSHRIAHILRILAWPLLILIIDLVIIQALSQLAALLFILIVGTEGPAFQDIAYLSKGVIVIPVLLLSSRFFERRSAAEVGFAPRRALQSIFCGLVISGVVMSIVTGIFTLMGWYHVQGSEGIGNAVRALAGGLLLSFVIAVYEEVLFRGIFFRLIERSLGSWIALCISALIFGGLHIANPHASWLSSLSIALEAGISLAAAYMLTRNLWLPIGLHWGWNFFEGSIFGFHVSGTSSQTWLQTKTTGPTLWTGGDFGPEAGLIAVLLWSIVSIVLLLLAVRQGKVILPSWIRLAQFSPPRSKPLSHLVEKPGH